jgi:hypothetical protein
LSTTTPLVSLGAIGMSIHVPIMVKRFSCRGYHLRSMRPQKSDKPRTRILVCLALLLLSPFQSPARDVPPDYAGASISQLIDELVNIDEPTAGIHGTLVFRQFLAEDAPPELQGGVFGSAPPKRFPQMAELVRRGVAAMPMLMDYLNDARPTKLSVGDGFFTFRYFAEEYDPRIRAPPQKWTRPTEEQMQAEIKSEFDHQLKGTYTVRVGDVCYALIGQIVNRNLAAVRYQPSAILVINSPVEMPSLAAKVRRDWSGVDSDQLKASLLSDARVGTAAAAGPALQRLRFYFPDEYRRQAEGGDLKDKIGEFERGTRH